MIDALHADGRGAGSLSNDVHAIMARFDSPEKLIHAIRTLRQAGYRDIEACTPFPVHGLDDALGARRSRLGLVVFAAGLAGLSAGLLLQWWTQAVDYPLVIGGKPFFAWQWSVPVNFELTILFAAFAAVLGMLAFNGLPRFHHPFFHYSRHKDATDDGFILIVESRDPLFHPEPLQRLITQLGGEHVETIRD